MQLARAAPKELDAPLDGVCLMTLTLASFVAWLEQSPPGTLLDAASVRGRLATIAEAVAVAPASTSSDGAPLSWRERLWIVPAETRLGVLEVAEAFNRPKSYVYRATAASAGASRLPHRKIDGELQFVVGELRAWIKAHEETICAGSTLTLSRRAS